MNKQTNTTMAMVYVEHLIAYGRKYLSLPAPNEFWARNNLMYELHLTERTDALENCEKELADILNPLVQYAVEYGIIDEADRERFGVRLTSLVMPTPAEVMERFDAISYSESTRYACDWFYDLCQKSGYIPMKAIAANPKWRFTASMGDIQVTINTAKPEKDPKEVAAAKAAPQTGYPKCMLCAENIGFYGKPGWAARSTLRAVPIVFDDGEQWYMQYSPYSYFTHHCIFFNSKHVPMGLSEKTFLHLTEIIRIFPSFFVGANAPLPIVGGSILAHDHFQGGAKVHPMFSRYLRARYTNMAYPNVKFGIVDWYNSVVRMRCRDRVQLVKAANYLYTMWLGYTDESVGIYAGTNGVQHNSVTPVFRMERGEYYCEMILRNNRTDEAHPFGIFHPTEDMHHIKKEAIGIIEALGTFILPGRLEKEMDQVADILCGATTFDEKALSDGENPMSKHKNMIVGLLKANGFVADKGKASEIVRGYINATCERILNCTAVFKNDEEGQAHFDKFMKSLGFAEFVFKEAEQSAQGSGEAKEETAEAVTEAAEAVQPAIENAAEGGSSAEAAIEDAPQVPVKRGRGRPKKNPDGKETTVKRGPGRPKKTE